MGWPGSQGPLVLVSCGLFNQQGEGTARPGPPTPHACLKGACVHLAKDHRCPGRNRAGSGGQNREVACHSQPGWQQGAGVSGPQRWNPPIAHLCPPSLAWDPGPDVLQAGSPHHSRPRGQRAGGGAGWAGNGRRWRGLECAHAAPRWQPVRDMHHGGKSLIACAPPEGPTLPSSVTPAPAPLVCC